MQGQESETEWVKSTRETGGSRQSQDPAELTLSAAKTQE
jgi:hypothetical protein